MAMKFTRIQMYKKMIDQLRFNDGCR